MWHDLKYTSIYLNAKVWGNLLERGCRRLGYEDLSARSGALFLGLLWEGFFMESSMVFKLLFSHLWKKKTIDLTLSPLQAVVRINCALVRNKMYQCFVKKKKAVNYYTSCLIAPNSPNLKMPTKFSFLVFNLNSPNWLTLHGQIHFIWGYEQRSVGIASSRN